MFSGDIPGFRGWDMVYLIKGGIRLVTAGGHKGIEMLGMVSKRRLDAATQFMAPQMGSDLWWSRSISGAERSFFTYVQNRAGISSEIGVT